MIAAHPGGVVGTHHDDEAQFEAACGDLNGQYPKIVAVAVQAPIKPLDVEKAVKIIEWVMRTSGK